MEKCEMWNQDSQTAVPIVRIDGFQWCSSRLMGIGNVFPVHDPALEQYGQNTVIRVRNNHVGMLRPSMEASGRSQSCMGLLDEMHMN